MCGPCRATAALSLQPRRSAVLISGWPPGPRQGWAAGSDRFWLLQLPVSRTFLDFLRLICSVHGYPARRASSTADANDRGAGGVREKWSWGVYRETVRLFRSSVPMFYYPTTVPGAGKALEIGPAIGYRLWFPSRESMNAVGVVRANDSKALRRTHGQSSPR